jgi:hypothetical protein
MNTLIFAHNKKWLFVGMLLLVLLVAACGGSDSTATEEATEVDAETVTETEEATEAEEPTLEPTDVPVVEFDGVIADTLPCEATIIPSNERRLNIRYNDPEAAQPAMIGAVVPGTALRIIEVNEVDGVSWYRSMLGNSFHGWIEAQYFVLGEGCVTGTATDSDDAEATEEVEATEEAEATEAADEATVEATEESD